MRETQTWSRNHGGPSTRRVSLKEIAGKDPDVGQPSETSPDGRGRYPRPPSLALATIFSHFARGPISQPMEMRLCGTSQIAAISERRIESIAPFLYNRHKNDSIAPREFAFTGLFRARRVESEFSNSYQMY